MHIFSTVFVQSCESQLAGMTAAITCVNAGIDLMTTAAGTRHVPAGRKARAAAWPAPQHASRAARSAAAPHAACCAPAPACARLQPACCAEAPAHAACGREDSSCCSLTLSLLCDSASRRIAASCSSAAAWAALISVCRESLHATQHADDSGKRFHPKHFINRICLLCCDKCMQ